MASIIAAVALFSASALAAGSAVVQNQCPYEVYLFAVPAAGGGYQQVNHNLPTGGSWSQQWTILTNSDGWSIKLSQSESLANIMQYEYTYHGDGIIWYDLSDVNGNPWDGNWEITAAGDPNCTPHQQAYRYATDDAYGMQSCDSDATITVTLCSGSGSGVSISSSVTAAPPATTSAPAPAPPPATPSTSSPQWTWTGPPNWQIDAAQATTLVTSPSPVPTTPTESPAVAVVYQTETEVATYVETVYERDAAPTPEAQPVKRHAHHPHHAHAPEA